MLFRWVLALTLCGVLLGGGAPLGGTPLAVGAAAPAALAVAGPWAAAPRPALVDGRPRPVALAPPRMAPPLLGGPPLAALPWSPATADPAADEPDAVPAPQALGEQATLEALRPEVQWSPAGAAGWQTVAARETVRAGDRVRTAAGAAGRLTYFEGTVTELGPSTAIVVSRLERTADGNLVLGVFQAVGTTLSRVVHLADPAASFDVDTPAATAFVRGTTLRVQVAADGTSRLANLLDDTESVVLVRGKDPRRSEVSLRPGEESVVAPGLEPTAPAPAVALGAEAPAAGDDGADQTARRQAERQAQRQQQQAFAAAQMQQSEGALALGAQEAVRLAEQERALTRQIGDLLAASGAAIPTDPLAGLPLAPPGPACADVPGQTCTVLLVGPPGSAVGGRAVGTVLASQLWRAEVQGLAAGATAVVVLQTTRGLELIPCPPAAPGTTVCVGRTLGNALLHTLARVFVRDVLVASGPVLGPDPHPLPRPLAATPTPPAPPSPTPTETAVPPASPSPSATLTGTPTGTPSPARTATSFATATASGTPTTTTTATASATPTATATPGCAAPLLLGAQGAAALSSSLFVLNPATGAVTSTIGPTGVGLTGLAQHPLTGQLYGSTTATSTQAPRSLVRLASSGAAVVVGSYGLPNDSMADLAFDGAGVLYGWSSLSGNLYRIDPATGAATRVGVSGLGVPQGAGLTFAQGSLFLSMDRDTGSLRRIDPATGTPLGAIPLSGGIGRPLGALAADPRGGPLLGARVDTGAVPRTADLVAIDPTSGAVTVRGASINQLDALAFACFP